MRRIILSLGGLGLSEPPAEEEWESQEIQLMDNQLSELPLSPNCPSLKALYLQRNFSLTCIPPLFFQYMPALQVLDMSGTSVRALPESLPMLVALQKLFLRDCPLLMEISPQVGELGNLEVLDLDGTEIVFLPLVTITGISEDTLKQGFSSEIAAPPAKISLDCDSQSSNSNYPSTKSAEEDDGYDWSISIQGKEKPMGNERQSYYVCKQPKCKARKIIVRSFDSQILGIVYTGRHDHSRPGSIMASPSPANSDQSPQNPKSGRDATCKNEPTRVALRTKVSGRDGLLSDGFSWRKYGSKRSQNGTISSYYRCSSHGCSANKCVEREPGDSEFVITTYFEKIHNHDTFFLEDINSAHVLGDSSCESASTVSQPAENGNSSNAGVLHKYDNSSELGSCKAHTKSTGIQQETVVLRSDGVENPACINVEQNCGLTHHG